MFFLVSSVRFGIFSAGSVIDLFTIAAKSSHPFSIGTETRMLSPSFVNSPCSSTKPLRSCWISACFSGEISAPPVLPWVRSSSDMPSSPTSSFIFSGVMPTHSPPRALFMNCMVGSSAETLWPPVSCILSWSAVNRPVS